MNLKKSILSFMAAGSILAGGFAGVAAQDTSTTGTVTVNDGGTFDAFFCSATSLTAAGASFGPGSVTSSAPSGALSGNLTICYTDSKLNRETYRTSVDATNFTSGTNSIAASNLKITRVDNPGQGKWGSGIGNVSALDPNGVSSSNGADWEVNNAFGSGSLEVHVLWPGMGTASEYYWTYPDSPYDYDVRSSNGAWGEINMELVVPAGTQSGTYTNEFTITMTPPIPE